MAEKTRYADHIKEWEKLGASLAANATELPQLEAPRSALLAVLEEVRTLAVEQAAFQAQKQQRSSRLGALMGEGKKIASMVRAVLKHHYGNRSEKLVEFGMQPFRTRSRKSVSVEPPPNPDPPANPSPSS